MGSACGVEVPDYMWEDNGSSGDDPSGDDAPDDRRGGCLHNTHRPNRIAHRIAHLCYDLL